MGMALSAGLAVNIDHAGLRLVLAGGDGSG
jgi:hypothetical protein